MSHRFGRRARCVSEDDARHLVLDLTTDPRPEALPRAAVFDQPAPTLLTQRPAEAIREGDSIAE